MRFPNESLVMKAQRDNFRDDGTTLDQVSEENVVEDESVTAIKRQRLATLAPLKGQVLSVDLKKVSDLASPRDSHA